MPRDSQICVIYMDNSTSVIRLPSHIMTISNIDIFYRYIQGYSIGLMEGTRQSNLD
jgi:hypothetical protein